MKNKKILVTGFYNDDKLLDFEYFLLKLSQTKYSIFFTDRA
jgi:hypothetical protein